MNGFTEGGRVPPNQNQKVFINTKSIIGLEAVYKDGFFWGSIIGEPKPYKSEEVLLWIGEGEYISNLKFALKEKENQPKVKSVQPSILDKNYQKLRALAAQWRNFKTRGFGDDRSINY